MKKIALGLMFLFIPLIFVGCGSNQAMIEENMAEITDIYFSAESGSNRASISVGKRENPYIIDGVCQKSCDFSLIVLNLEESLTDKIIAAKIYINGTESDITLDINPISQSYMLDLGYALKGDDEVKLSYNDLEFEFKNSSKDFAVSQEEALSVAKTQLSGEISRYTKGNSFEGECYLKVLSLAPDFEELFWVFTIEGRDGKTYNIIISVDDPLHYQMTN